MKRWPHSFDEIVLERLGAPKYGDLTTMDAISRTKLAGGLMTSIDRLPSAKARELVRSRLMEVLGLQADFVEASHLVTEPVMSLPISSSGLDGRR